MTIRKFLVSVIREAEFLIELDDSVMDENYLEDFRKVFYQFDEMEEHAEHLAMSDFQFGEDSFLEGYGHVLRDGKLVFSFEKDREPAKGVNIRRKGDETYVLSSKEIE